MCQLGRNNFGLTSATRFNGINMAANGTFHFADLFKNRFAIIGDTNLGFFHTMGGIAIIYLTKYNLCRYVLIQRR